MSAVFCIFRISPILELGVLCPTIRKSQVRPHLPHLLELLPCILGAYGRRHNHVTSDLPIHRCRDPLFIAGLQTVYHPQNLGRVPSHARRIHHRQPHFLRRIDDEHAADRERDSFRVDVAQILLVDHVVQPGDLAVGVGDDGELEISAGNIVDILDPSVVGTKVVGGEADHLDAAAGEVEF